MNLLFNIGIRSELQIVFLEPLSEACQVGGTRLGTLVVTTRKVYV